MKPGPNQEAWFAALESGEHEQTTEQLECEGKYCCLGVACVTADRSFDFESFSLTLPPVSVWDGFLSLRSPSGTSQDERRLTSCARLNDVDRLTFPQIAAHLREHFDAYFTDSR